MKNIKTLLVNLFILFVLFVDCASITKLTLMDINGSTTTDSRDNLSAAIATYCEV